MSVSPPVLDDFEKEPSAAPDSPASPQTGKMPTAVPYIIGNEAAERFSFYGMKAILTTFLATYFFLGQYNGDVAQAQSAANAQTHGFIALTYALPLIGGMLADWFLGKYRTIFYLSLVYCLGHALLAIFENQLDGFIFGLLLISLGSGGIKPCVSANVGDQFDKSNQHLMSGVFSAFYFAINFGSFFSTLLTPFLLKAYGPAVAFGIPGILMGLATIVFWLGRNKYVKVPPKGDKNKAVVFANVVGAFLISYGLDLQYGIGTGGLLGSWLVLTLASALMFQKWWFAKPGNFIGINLYALLNGGFRAAEERYSVPTIDGVRAVWRVLSVFAFIPFFWALYDQNGSEWVLQAKMMDKNFLGVEWQAEQVQAINPILILLFIPLFTTVIYPLVEKMGIKLTPLRKIGAGFLLTALSFIFIAIPEASIHEFILTIPDKSTPEARQALIDQYLASGNAPSIAWQLVAYAIITAGETLISITGLEYAYTQAPPSMKSTIMACWLLTVTLGNVLVEVIHKLMNSNPAVHNFLAGSMFYWFFMGICLVTLVVFMLVSPRIKEKSYIGE